MKKYSTYKPTGINWLQKMPLGWQFEKLKFNASIQFSNVDKLSEKSESPVLLCNYVDVYKNEKIHGGIDFMQATANESEIKKFKIKKGDVIITKDSESVDDIAVPALVTEDFENVLCGYHLAQIKAHKKLTGEYLFRLFQSKDFNQNFESAANGMTRYGLSVYSIKNVVIPIPSLVEQYSIVRFLDYKTDQIDRFIANRQKQIELLKEQKAAIINKAVTKGIDPDAKMKPSGIEWIGEIPEHWEVIKLKFTNKILMGQSPDSKDVNNEGNGIPFLQGNAEFTNINPIPLNFCSKPNKIALKNDLLVSVRAPVGEINIADQTYGIGRGLCAIRVKKSCRKYLYFTFSILKQELNKLSTGTTFLAITVNELHNVFLPHPSLLEQESISNIIQKEIDSIDKLISKYQKQIDLMQEYRTALISQAVTGKIDVRDWQPKAKEYVLRRCQ